MPARFKPNLSIVGPDLVFQIAVGYVDSIPIAELINVPLFIAGVDTASGGPGAPDAYPIRISETELKWNALAGEYLSDEDGNQLVDEDDNILIGEPVVIVSEISRLFAEVDAATGITVIQRKPGAIIQVGADLVSGVWSDFEP